MSWNSRTIRSTSSTQRNKTINDPGYYNGDIKHDKTFKEPTISKSKTREEAI